MYSETVARVAEAVHKPKQHLLNVLQLVHIHLEEEYENHMTYKSISCEENMKG